MFELYTDKKGEYRWRFRDIGLKKILFACTEGYKERRDAERCILRAKGSANCEVRDLTGS
jgi:uncharacterized protein YegP (UPF0339 family)